jgi:hypothetical protein
MKIYSILWVRALDIDPGNKNIGVNMRSFSVVLSFSLLVVGCSSKSIIREYSQETYAITVVADNSFDSLDDMQTKALNEAHTHCAEKSKKYVFLSQQIKPVRTAADSEEVNLYFRCK